MTNAAILELIWSNNLEMRETTEMSPLSHAIGALMKVPTIGFVSRFDLEQPVAMMDGEELLPGATLGDVLDEELGLFLEPGTLVIIESEGFADAQNYSASELGGILGQILVGLAGMQPDVFLSDPVNKRAGVGKPDAGLFNSLGSQIKEKKQASVPGPKKRVVQAQLGYLI